MMLILVLIFLQLKFCNVHCIINPHGPNIASEYTDCMKNLIERSFEESGMLVFVYTNELSLTTWRIRSELLQTIHSQHKYLIRVSTPTEDKGICTEHTEEIQQGSFAQKKFYKPVPIANYYIIIVDNYHDFTKIMHRLFYSQSWNPGARFIVLFYEITSPNDIKIKTAERILQCLFKTNVIRSIVVFPDANNIRNGLVYGWKALDPPQYCGYNNETTEGRLILQNICEQGKLKHNDSLFVDVLPSNMMGCHIKILALERQPFISDDQREPNVERHFVGELLRKFNYTPDFEIVNCTRGELSATGEWEGALKKLVQRKGELLVGAIFPDDDVHKDFECSTTYLADSYTWVVARAQRVPALMSVIITFDMLVWYSAIAGFVVCVLAWMFFGRLDGDTIYHRSFGHCFMNAFVSNVGFCAYARPVKKSLRVFFCFFCIYCIVFITAFQTKLIDVLTNPSYNYQIKTVEEILESGKRFGGSEMLHDIFYNSTDPLDNYIGEQWLDIHNIHQGMRDVVIHRNFSLLCSRLEIEYLSSTLPGLTDSYGHLKYYALEDNIFTVPIEMVALKGFPFVEEFSLMIGKFKQLGLSDKVKREFQYMAKFHRGVLLDNLDDDDPDVKSLSMSHLQGGFMALALGYISGSIVLLMEIFLNSAYAQTKIRVFYKKVLKRE